MWWASQAANAGIIGRGESINPRRSRPTAPDLHHIASGGGYQQHLILSVYLLYIAVGSRITDRAIVPKLFGRVSQSVTS